MASFSQGTSPSGMGRTSAWPPFVVFRRQPRCTTSSLRLKSTSHLRRPRASPRLRPRVDRGREEWPPPRGKRLHDWAHFLCPQVVVTRPFRFGTCVRLLGGFSLTPLPGFPRTVEASHKCSPDFVNRGRADFGRLSLKKLRDARRGDLLDGTGRLSRPPPAASDTQFAHGNCGVSSLSKRESRVR
jgi:hypothetical protein